MAPSPARTLSPAALGPLGFQLEERALLQRWSRHGHGWVCPSRPRSCKSWHSVTGGSQIILCVRVPPPPGISRVPERKILGGRLPWQVFSWNSPPPRIFGPRVPAPSFFGQSRPCSRFCLKSGTFGYSGTYLYPETLPKRTFREYRMMPGLSSFRVPFSRSLFFAFSCFLHGFLWSLFFPFLFFSLFFSLKVLYFSMYSPHIDKPAGSGGPSNLFAICS